VVQSSLLTPVRSHDAARARPFAGGRSREKRKRNLPHHHGILVPPRGGDRLRGGIGRPRSRSPPTVNRFFPLNLNLIVFLLLLVLLFRNLVKLSFERRQKIIGSKFKAKLVLTFWPCPWCPVSLIFLIASTSSPLHRGLVQAAGRESRSTRPWRWRRPTTELETTALRHGALHGRVIERDGLLARASARRWPAT